MSMISPQLRNQVTQHLFTSIVREINVFKGQNDIADMVVQSIEVRSYMAEDYIFK